MQKHLQVRSFWMVTSCWEQAWWMRASLCCQCVGIQIIWNENEIVFTWSMQRECCCGFENGWGKKTKHFCFFFILTTRLDCGCISCTHPVETTHLKWVTTKPHDFLSINIYIWSSCVEYSHGNWAFQDLIVCIYVCVCVCVSVYCSLFLFIFIIHCFQFFSISVLVASFIFWFSYTCIKMPIPLPYIFLWNYCICQWFTFFFKRLR